MRMRADLIIVYVHQTILTSLSVIYIMGIAKHTYASLVQLKQV